MREILFRGKRKDTDEWVEGAYLKLSKNNRRKHFILQINDYDFSDNRLSPANIEIDPSTLGQFTNTQDINLKKIFKDDRVKVSWLAELGITELDCESVGTVKWNEFQARWVVVFDKPHTEHLDCGIYEVEEIELLNTQNIDDYSISYEIIGNIHDKEERK